MKPLTALILAAGTTAFLLSAICAFNFQVDPLCTFHCKKIEVNRRTKNHYYQIAQKIVGNDNARVIILGSSRGQTIPIPWLQDKMKLKVLNLSIGGAELWAKLAFLRIALERQPIKKVIWLADYFELIPETADIRIKYTPVLKKYLGTQFPQTRLESFLGGLRELIDHNTLEASFYTFKKDNEVTMDQGSGSGLDYKTCMKINPVTASSEKSLESETMLTYQTYSSQVFPPAQSEKEWNVFVHTVQSLSERRISTTILVTPYRRTFRDLVQKEHPEIWARHLAWIKRLETIYLPYVNIVNRFDGFPGDDNGPAYWTDGVHFSCKGSAALLNTIAL